MKLTLSIISLLSAFSALAENSPHGIFCREDNRVKKGSLREVILTTTANNTYELQSQSVSSLNSRDIAIENLAKNLSCHVDKSLITFCNNPEGDTVLIKDRREAFLDSMQEDEKIKRTKYIDIWFKANGVEKTLTFLAGDCHAFGEET